nr:hypothetical protein (asnA 5' region) - Escherichia coli [Escherichia coli]
MLIFSVSPVCFAPEFLSSASSLSIAPTKGVIFTTANTDCAKADCRKIGLLFLQCFIERRKVVRNISGTVGELITSQIPEAGKSSNSGPCSVSVVKPASSSFSARCSATYSAPPRVLPLIRVISAINRHLY